MLKKKSINTCNMCPKVSIIVPIYGVEQYIERCARSLFEQTLDSIEYVFVNDCTPDSSISILKSVIDEYPERSNLIKIINLPRNCGCAITRGIGLRKANGEFISTCDSDDWVEKTAYETLYSAAISNKADVAVCDYFITDGRKKQVVRGMIQSEKNGFIEDMLYHHVSWSIWNKLFKRTLFDDSTVFPAESMGEDFALTLQLVHRCQKVTHVNSPLYNYFQHSQSIIHRKEKVAVYNKFRQAMKNTELITDFYREKGMDKELEGGLANLKYQTKSLLLPVIHEKNYERIWKETFPNIEKKILFDSHNSMKDRVKSLLIILKIYPKVTNFLRITHCK